MRKTIVIILVMSFILSGVTGSSEQSTMDFNDIHLDTYKNRLSYNFEDDSNYLNLEIASDSYPNLDDQLIFNSLEIDELGQTAWGLSKADFNEDGNIDFIVSSATDPWTLSRISLYINNGNNDYSRNDIYIHDNFTSNFWYLNDLECNDFDNDGDIDILFSYSEFNESYWNTYGIIKILYNNGLNSFDEEKFIVRLGSGDPKDPEKRINPHLTSGDYDNDGNIDFIVGDNSGKIELYKNDGSGNFQSHGIIYDFGQMSWGLQTVDFNKDGYLDLLISAEEKDYYGHIHLLYNNGNESCFDDNQGEILINSSGSTASFEVFDYDKDNDFDFFIGAGNDIYLIINENGKFTTFHVCILPDGPEGFSESLHVGGSVVGDFNNDNYQDILIGGVQGHVRILFNNYNKSAIGHISKPKGYWLYFFDKEIFYQGFGRATAIIGKLTVSANAYGKNISHVEFYLDDELVYDDYEYPYEWLWNDYKLALSPDKNRHFLKIITYNEFNESAPYDELFVRKYL